MLLSGKNKKRLARTNLLKFISFPLLDKYKPESGH